MKERTAYQRQMDEVRLSDQKKEETLRLLLAENQRLRAEDPEPSTVPARKKWIPAAALAAVACLVLLAAGLSGRGGADFESIRLSSLPQIGARGGGSEPMTFSEAFGRTPESLFTADSVTEGTAASVFLQGETRHRGELQVVSAGKTLTAAVTDFEPPLYTALRKTQEIGGIPVRLAEDPDTGRRYAVYVRDGLYVVLSSDGLSGKDFTAAVSAVIRK